MVVTAGLFFKIGSSFFGVVPPIGKPLGVIAVFVTYLTALVLLFSGLFDVDFKRRQLAWGTVGSLSFVYSTAYATVEELPKYGTDAMVYAKYSVNLLLDGRNPYSEPMNPAFEMYQVTESYVTYTTGAEILDTLSYPALSFLVYLPQEYLFGGNLNFTSVVFLLVTLCVLIYLSPRYLSFAPFVVLLADKNITFFTVGGVFDIVWVFFILVAIHFWSKEQIYKAGVFVGLAICTKQIPWLIAPYLVLWILLSQPTVRTAIRRSGLFTIVTITTMFVPNIPFLIWDAESWLTSVFAPIFSTGAPAIKQGFGLVFISVSGSVPLSKTFYTVAVLLSLLTYAIIYVLYFDTIKWTAWVVPAATLFVHYRSLQNYFIFFIPLAYAIIITQSKVSDPLNHNQTLFERINHRNPLPKQATAVTVVLIVVCTLGMVGATSTNQAQMNAELDVINYSDADSIGRYTQLTVRVTNNGTDEITPVFNLLHEDHQTRSYWVITDGPKTVEPDETETYTIQAPTARLALQYSTETGILAMNDKSTQKTTKTTLSIPERHPTGEIQNPRFRYWLVNQRLNTDHPFRWSNSQSNLLSETVKQERVSNGVQLSIMNASDDKNTWTMSSLTQEVPLPNLLTITATPQSVSRVTKYPNRLTGVSITDRNYRIWILFSDTDKRVTLYRSQERLQYAIIHIPATPKTKTTATVNITQVYERFNWKKPPKEQFRQDGQTYTTRYVRVMPFTAIYPSSEANKTSMTVHSLTTTPNVPLRPENSTTK